MSFAGRPAPTFRSAFGPAFPWRRRRNEYSACEFANRHACAALRPLRQGAGYRGPNVPLHAMHGAAGSGLSGMGRGTAGIRAAPEGNLAGAARIATAGELKRRLALPRAAASG